MAGSDTPQIAEIAQKKSRDEMLGKVTLYDTLSRCASKNFRAGFP